MDPIALDPIHVVSWIKTTLGFIFMLFIHSSIFYFILKLFTPKYYLFNVKFQHHFGVGDVRVLKEIITYFDL